MNFIEVCRLLEIDKSVVLLRRNNKDLQITVDVIGKFLIDVNDDDAFIPSIEEILADDWYVVRKTRLTFEEAIAALKRGKTIKRECWITKEIDRDFCDDYSIAFTIDDFEANDWIIVGD